MTLSPEHKLSHDTWAIILSIIVIGVLLITICEQKDTFTNNKSKNKSDNKSKNKSSDTKYNQKWFRWVPRYRPFNLFTRLNVFPSYRTAEDLKKNKL